MKKYVTVSLFVFWVITVSVVTAGLITYDKNKQNSNQINNSAQAQNQKNLGSAKNNLNLTMSEIAKHNSSKSCWLLISGKVYDVTSFLNNHPGEASSIIPTCGTDATFAYDVKGPASKSHAHSKSANSMLADYFIGNLNQTVSVDNTIINTAKTNTPVASRGGEEDDD